MSNGNGAWLGVCLATLLLACGEAEVPEPPEPTPAELRVVADPLLVPLARDLIAIAPDLVNVRPRAEEEVAAFAALLRGEVDVVFALRRPSADEQREAAGRDVVAGDPLRATALAYDELVLIVPDGSPIEALRTSELAELLSGSRSEWAGLGGSQPVQLFALPRGTSAWDAVKRAIPGLEAPPPGLQAQPTDAEVARQVTDTPGGLGLCSRSVAQGVRLLALNAEHGTLRPGAPDWPLTREIVLVTRGEHPRASRLVKAASSAPGLKAILERGFRPTTGARP